MVDHFIQLVIAALLFVHSKTVWEKMKQKIQWPYVPSQLLCTQNISIKSEQCMKY